MAAAAAAAAAAALQQCQLLQNLIDISICSLQGLRTKCTASCHLTQQEIHTLEVRLLKYITKQLQCKQRVPACERSLALDSYPHLVDWLYTVNVRPEVIQAVPVKLSLDELLHMSGAQVQETMRKLGVSGEDCSRITTALSCLKSATDTGQSNISCPKPGRELKDEGIPWIVEPPRCNVNALTSAELPYSPNPASPLPFIPSGPCAPRSVSVSTVPSLDCSSLNSFDGLSDCFHPSPQLSRRPLASTPPLTPPINRSTPRTPPSNRLLQLLPTLGLPRSKSQTQLANRVDEPAPNKNGKKNKLLLNVQVNGGGNCEDSLSSSSLLSVSSPCTVPNTPTHQHTNLVDSLTLKSVLKSSPQTIRRDFGLTFSHRFSTKSWMSQTCEVCKKTLMFGVKCKHCKLKCHNKCTKEAPQCKLPFPVSPIRRTESVPSDIHNKVDQMPQLESLLKAQKEQTSSVSQLDSSSNPSSTTSSTPSSPAAFSQSNPPSATPPPNPSPKGARDNRFYFPAACYFQFRQQFIFPDRSNSPHPDGCQDRGETEQVVSELTPQSATHQEAVNEDVNADEDQQEHEKPEDAGSDDEGEGEEDDLDDLPSSLSSQRKAPFSRKPSQTSVYLQEWHVPFFELELGELIGKGRWGKVYRGRWHGEVAVRLLEIDGNNQGHLKLFKKEVMNYRQTRHENVVLFMGACMNPPQLAIITSFCKGRTLYSVVRDSKNSLDLNKTRQIAQEIVKGMGYLHAKEIVHKDLKSKNVFYDTNKVVITDFGLFGMSGVVQEDRRENELKLPQGWIYYLAPEIVRRMCPGNDEEHLPFSKAADVYAFGTIWYELQAREWPITNQPAEAAIWQLGSGEGIKRQLRQISLGKEVTDILSACWSFELEDRPTFSQLADQLEKLPKLNRRLSHPGHFWKSADSWRHHCLREHCSQGTRSRCPYAYKYDS
ncbi:kinase suppressor of Ras 1 isoform X2 [Salminus brasiliensis]|uniref:kinase suppressor of Ras 1 isoform X2 n=1 Tax=Salminus brasiliensis TaxID=930266 RepID=UPI003B834B97